MVNLIDLKNKLDILALYFEFLTRRIIVISELKGKLPELKEKLDKLARYL
jgi:hypothetical protein